MLYTILFFYLDGAHHLASFGTNEAVKFEVKHQEQPAAGIQLFLSPYGMVRGVVQGS